VSSNDFDGPYGPAGARGSDDNSGGARDASRNGGNRGGYAPPEGWGDDGFWRDSSIDANYETGGLQPLDPRSRGRGGGRGGGSREGDPRGGGRDPHNGGYGRRQADPGPGPGPGPGGGYSARHGNPRGGYGPGGPRNSGPGGPGAPNGPAGPGGPVGPGAPGGRGGYGPGNGGYGPDATQVQQGGYRGAIQRVTGPITGPITDQWRRMGSRMAGRGQAGPPAGRRPVAGADRPGRAPVLRLPQAGGLSAACYRAPGERP